MNSNQTYRFDKLGASAVGDIASCTVMPALVAGIHVFLSLFAASKTWMAGTSPAMTWRVIVTKQFKSQL
jgi:hypothetical protein